MKKRENEELWKDIAEVMPVAIVISHAVDGLILFHNKLFEFTFGVPGKKLIGRPKSDFYCNPQECELLFANLHQGGVVRDREVYLKKADGTPFWAQTSMHSIKFNGETAILSIFLDISESKFAQQSLKRQALTFENIYDGVILTDIHGHIIDWNPAATRMFGYSKTEVLGKTPAFLHKPQEAAVLTQQILKKMKEDGRWVGEINFIRKDGSEGVCETIVVPMLDKSHRIVATIGVNRDLTEQKQAQVNEDLLLDCLKSRERQQAAVALLGQKAIATSDYHTLLDTAATIVAKTLNVKFSKVLELLPGNNALLLRAGVGWKKGLVGKATITAAREKSQAGYTLFVNKPVIIKDLPVETSFSGCPLLHNHHIVSGATLIIPNLKIKAYKTTDADPTHKAWGILGVHSCEHREFTQDEIYFLEAIANILATAIERHANEEHLELMKRALDSSNNGIVITDATQPDNPIIYVNPSFQRITGYKTEELIGKNCRFLQGKSTNQLAISKLRNAILHGQECHVILQNSRKDGTNFWNELFVAPVYNSQQHLTHFIGIQTDVTERFRWEAELFIKSQALEKFSSSLKQLHRIATCNYNNIEELFADYLQAGCEIFGTDTGVIGEVKEELYMITAVQSKQDYFVPGRKFNLCDTFCNRVLKEQRTISIDELEPSEAKSMPIKVYICTPIFVNHQIYGTLCFLSPQARIKEFEYYEEEIIELMAQGIGKFITAHQIELERQQAEVLLRESEKRYRRLVEYSPEAISVVWMEKIVYINTAGAHLLGAKSPTEIIGQLIWKFIHPDYIEVEKQRLQKVQHQRQQTHLEEEKLITLNGEIIDVEITGIPYTYYDDAAVQIIIRDITQRKQAQQKLLHDALHDALTGLPNRTLLFDRLEQALRRSRQHLDYEFVVLFLDLDRFKVINDSLGHYIGDQLLIAIAKILQSCIKASDTLARLGGDEFTILLEYPPDISYAARVAHKINQKLAKPVYIEGHEIFTTASIGIVHSRGNFANHTDENHPPICPIYNNPEDLLRDADIAMYRAKASGKARHEVFDLIMHDQAISLLELENDLRRAVEMIKQDPANSQFVLNYQPIICLSTGKITGFEALIRWHHPNKGLISPGQFIPLAEETGLIVPLGMWVLRAACNQLTIWQQEFFGHKHQENNCQFIVNNTQEISSTSNCLSQVNNGNGNGNGKCYTNCPAFNSTCEFPNDNLTMSVNLSSNQISQPNLVEEIEEILQATDCKPNCLKLEITETVIMENVILATTVLNQLKNRNIKLSIDDFGTGYSSLSYLHQFPINSLKIDRSFVSPLDSDVTGQSLKIVSAITALAHNLGLDIVAEGIETQEQMQQLKQLKCEKGQGYLFSKPVDSYQATKLLHNFNYHQILHL
ncbi:PAS domain S-box protein [Okeania sp. SIO2B3]|uniref:PAS domain S-box protein n=1 Tax=Okeania sp. SIO2B3 TaxID=2607784 RepID=UPI0013C1ED52|nr:PAS domain S-box protein [Okeania sp. SIO2B3]NET42174.1 PAS domain S-box protein [Okeania sp. SIO2B3]